MRRVIPNLISASRLVLILPLGLMLWVSAHNGAWRWGVIGLFLWMAFSDWLDGYLARRFAAQSALGRVLDPAADKALALVCFLVLAVVGMRGHYFPLPVWLIVLVIGKDVWTVLGYVTMRAIGVEMAIRPSAWGKASTGLQLLLVGSILLGPELVWLGLGWARNVLMWLTAVLTAAAVASYSLTAVRRLSTVQLVELPGPAPAGRREER